MITIMNSQKNNLIILKNNQNPKKNENEITQPWDYITLINLKGITSKMIRMINECKNVFIKTSLVKLSFYIVFLARNFLVT